MYKKISLIFIYVFISLGVCSAQQDMSLSEVIRTARFQSVEALQARQAFISTYWAYRSYRV